MLEKISKRDLLMAAGGCVVGMAVGTLLLKKAKNDIKKEIISEHTKAIKNELLGEIKSNIQVEEIKRDVKKQLSRDIVNDILSESTKQIDKMKKDIDDFADKIDTFEDQVLDFDKRVGKLVNMGIGAVIKAVDRKEN